LTVCVVAEKSNQIPILPSNSIRHGRLSAEVTGISMMQWYSVFTTLHLTSLSLKKYHFWTYWSSRNFSWVAQAIAQFINKERN